MSDEIHLLDMLIAAKEAQGFLAGMDEAEFADSRLHQMAVVKLIEIIGEAAKRVSEDFRAQHPQIPWAKIAGMRNRLVHDYTNIDVPTVWSTVILHLPQLVRDLEPLVPPDTDAPAN